MHDSNLLEDQPIAWTPTPDVIERAQLTKFMKQVGVSTWDELYEFSICDVEKFTEEVIKFLDIKFDPPYEKLLDTSNGIEFPKWFSRRGDKRSGDTPVPMSAKHERSSAASGSEDKSVLAPTAGLNVTTMCLDRWQTEEMKDQPAVIWEGEEGYQDSRTYTELLDEVNNCAAGLRYYGFGKGDAIGIHMPMVVETVVALLAINRIGAIAVPVFSGYGVEAIASRLNAVRARALFTSNRFPRRGKEVTAYKIAYQAVTSCPTIEKVFVVLRDSVDDDPDFSSLVGLYEDYNILTMIEGADPANNPDGSAELTSAEDPLIILYTSGTTGKPKGIAHTHASFPIKAAHDMAFGTDVGRGTRICWYTDIGWMMGPWLIYGALINGATICIYDGAPDYTTPDRMWEFCAKHKVEILGISPTLIRALSNCGDDLPKKHDLSSLRAFASTGEPWNPAPWWWLFEKVGNSKLPIINYSGGTEIAGGILMGNPLLPIKPCSFPAPCPGMDVDILDEDGISVEAGKVGELVIKQPWIGMARGFWQEKERYLETYWSRFKNIWVHGDWAMRDKDGHWFILGRSDDTLKVAGKRVGPAEVESLLVAHPAVTEAAVIGVPDEVKGTAMVAFVVRSRDIPVPTDAASALEKTSAASGSEDKRVLAPLLKALVAKDMGKPLAPSMIHFVSALPKTRNAKVMRRVIRAAYLGEDPGDLSSLENPQAVDEIAELGRKNV
jgi:acetyl-CoA synthetase